MKVKQRKQKFLASLEAIEVGLSKKFIEQADYLNSTIESAVELNWPDSGIILWGGPTVIDNWDNTWKEVYDVLLAKESNQDKTDESEETAKPPLNANADSFWREVFLVMLNRDTTSFEEAIITANEATDYYKSKVSNA